MVARAWHSALSRSMALVEDLELARDSTLEAQKEALATQLLPIQTVPLPSSYLQSNDGLETKTKIHFKRMHPLITHPPIKRC